LIFAADDYKKEWQGLSSDLIDISGRKRIAHHGAVPEVFMEHGQGCDACGQPDTLYFNVRFISAIHEIAVQ
jgi:hypothetical protein